MKTLQKTPKKGDRTFMNKQRRNGLSGTDSSGWLRIDMAEDDDFDMEKLHFDENAPQVDKFKDFQRV